MAGVAAHKWRGGWKSTFTRRSRRTPCAGFPRLADQPLLRVLTVGAAAGLVTGRSLGVLAVRQGPAHFAEVARLCAAGEVTTRVDRVVGLDDVPEALTLVGEGRALGKVVVAP